MTLTFMIYGTDIGEIYGTFGAYMAYIYIYISTANNRSRFSNAEVHKICKYNIMTSWNKTTLSKI